LSVQTGQESAMLVAADVLLRYILHTIVYMLCN